MFLHKQSYGTQTHTSLTHGTCSHDCSYTYALLTEHGKYTPPITTQAHMTVLYIYITDRTQTHTYMYPLLSCIHYWHVSATDMHLSLACVFPDIYLSVSCIIQGHHHHVSSAAHNHWDKRPQFRCIARSMSFHWRPHPGEHSIVIHKVVMGNATAWMRDVSCNTQTAS